MTEKIPVFRKHKDRYGRMIYTIYSDATMQSAIDTIDLNYFTNELKKYGQTLDNVQEEFYVQ